MIQFLKYHETILIIYAEYKNILDHLLMKYFYSLMLCASLMFTSCTEGSDSTEELKLAEGIPTEIIVGDDGTADVKEIKFEASSSWIATVRNVSENRSGGSEVEWLELDKEYVKKVMKLLEENPDADDMAILAMI